jgi:hypothetical protein
MTRSQRRTFVIAIAILIVAGGVAAAVLLRYHAAPEPARLLPEADGILYANLKPLRPFVNFDDTQQNWTPEYRNFVQQTGIHPERDLDEIAFAIHSPKEPSHETRFSEVMVGRFNSLRLADYLSRIARSRENYGNHEVFVIPYEDRVVRATILSIDMVAASNTGDPAQIDHIIDQFSRVPFAASGPELLHKYYLHVPLGAIAWLITAVEPPTTINLGESFGILPLLRQVFGGGVVVASARYNGNLLLRADTFLKGDALKDRTEQLNNLLSLYRASEQQTPPSNPDAAMEAALNSIKVEQKSDRVELTMSISKEAVEHLFEPPKEPEPVPPRPPIKANPKHKRRRP